MKNLEFLTFYGSNASARRRKSSLKFQLSFNMRFGCSLDNRKKGVVCERVDFDLCEILYCGLPFPQFKSTNNHILRLHISSDHFTFK